MATRVGIELAPDACRIIEIDTGPVWARRGGETRVRSFAVLPPSGPETQARLKALRKRRAAVVVWAAADHRQVMVSSGSYEAMRAEAMGSLAAAGVPTRGVWADIAPAARGQARSARRPVVVTLASGSQLTTALQPLRDAGIRLWAVTTPAVALASLARLRRDFSVPDAMEVYVALEEHVTCVAMIRGGMLLAARDFAWGYVDELGAGTEPRRREDITTRLVDAISEFLAAIGGEPRDVGQVCVCGGLPELRSMTAPLMERLDVEVEPLDSLFGIDAAELPDPIDEFRERGAEMRLAWAAAADWPPPINLLRARNRQVSKMMLARAAVVTGVAAGLVVGWRVQRSPSWQARVPRPENRTASNVRPAGRAAPPAVTPPIAVANKPPVVPPPVVANRPPVVPPPAVASKPPVVPPPAVANRPPVVPPPAVANKPPVVPPPAVASKPPVVVPPPVVANRPPVVPPPAVANRAPVVVPPPAVANRAPVVVPPPAVANKPPVVVPPPAVANRPPVVPLPPATQTRPPVVPPAARTTEDTRPALVPRPVAPRPGAARSPAAPAAGPLPVQVPERVAPPPERSGSLLERAAPAPVRLEPVPTRDRARPAPPPEVALAFDAVLGTILYSSDRKLAIIDGRIVGPGDEVRGARVVDITQTAVLLRDGQGRLRRLGLGSGGR